MQSLASPSLSEILAAEHEQILVRIEQLAWALTRGNLVAIRLETQLLRGQLELHREKEEEALIPVLGRRVGFETAPVAATMSEHKREERLFIALEVALERNEAEAVRPAAEDLVEFLRNHMWKEEAFLFPVVDATLAPDEAEKVRAEFARIDQRVAG